MAREYEAEDRPMPEPLFQRVLTLEKQVRELREQLHEQDAEIRRVGRELGMNEPR